MKKHPKTSLRIAVRSLLLLLALGSTRCALPTARAAGANSAPKAAEPWLWPIAGAAAGEGILYQPQTHIGDELVFAELFIGAAEGTEVVAPADATVTSVSLSYNFSLTYSSSFQDDEPLDRIAEKLSRRFGTRVDPRNIGTQISLTLADGRRLHLHGLRSVRSLRTGERVQRGEVLGTVGCSYHRIAQPSISLSCSTPSGQSSDPMAPFGLRSTFLPPDVRKVEHVSRSEAEADFDTLMQVLTAAYPGLCDNHTPEEVEHFRTRFRASIPDGMSIEAWYCRMRQAVSFFHDSHLTLYPPESQQQQRYYILPALYFGWTDSTCVVTRTTRGYGDCLGRRIRSIDGIPADTLRARIAAYVCHYDGAVESVRDAYLLTTAQTSYLTFLADTTAGGGSAAGDITFEFDDGEVLHTRGWRYDGRDLRGLSPDWTPYFRINARFALRNLDDSTAYIGLPHFSLNEMEIDSLRRFVRASLDRPHLIVDVRNNPGGEVKTLQQIASLFADRPFAPLGSYQWIARPDSIAAFEGCGMNYTATMPIVDGFRYSAAHRGWIAEDESAVINPDSTLCYRGKLYVLTNEGSCSAATLFPALMLRNHRGLIVGRETATTYHRMNAFKFVEIRLPHSGLTLRIPLVRCVFDETEHPRLPRGRGVLPDFPVRLTTAELFAPAGRDSILEYTLDLIRRGIYLDPADPFALPPSRSGRSSRGWILLGSIVLLAGAWRLLRRRK